MLGLTQKRPWTLHRSRVAPRRRRCVMSQVSRAFAVDQFLRKNILRLKPYTPIEPFEVVAEKIGKSVKEVVKLDANENLYGPPPEVFASLAALQSGHIYPDPETRKLRKALSAWVNVPMEHLLVGCGADELIDLLLRCVLDDGDAIVDCPPTFAMYSFDTAICNGRILQVVRNPDFSLNVPGIKCSSPGARSRTVMCRREVVMKEKPKAIFLTSPNNPDGSCIAEAELLEILDLPVLVVLDEAYQEFTDRSSRITWVPSTPNLVVLRTFSKCAALAGLRVGYGAFPLDLITYLWRAKQPYNVSVAAEVAACAALSNPTYMQETRDLIISERQRLMKALHEVPFLLPHPSESNFILCKVEGTDAKELKEVLYKEGVLIRHYNTELLKGYVRISVGKPEHTDALIAALRRLGPRKE